MLTYGREHIMLIKVADSSRTKIEDTIPIFAYNIRAVSVSGVNHQNISAHHGRYFTEELTIDK